MEYADEPRLIFSPVSEQDYSNFYNLEMADFRDDVPFYANLLTREDQVLELGCGTGRLTRVLAALCKHITGIDHSVEMLKIAEQKKDSNVTYGLMDMLDLSFSTVFDVIIIPYNTLNLLGEKNKVDQCLGLCSKHLTHNGKLAMQIYHPDTANQRTNGIEKQFQFAIFDDLKGGKIIKETLKWYEETNTILNLEERYRVRPGGDNKKSRDLRHTLKLYTPAYQQLETLLHSHGFSIQQTFSNGMGAPFSADLHTTLFIHAEKF